ncbi:TetR/AcrR family transcriptional regulator C-terminal ligand-binding domain-containing protein [Sphaerisporangium sp. NPDC051011]|uniref:TetR/AcrR family transcriptional regulator C-terminal ligand-binding domain-containing protein n=1 Tax=Sphaerisporangium sp. NPDC051011 TaxID=3155792 RepID=UPI0033DB0612
MRQRVLDAAVELIAENGVTHVRYADVADLAGVHRSSLYRNWPEQTSLIREAILMTVEQQVPLHDTGDLRADLVDFLCALSDVFQSTTGRALARALYAHATEPEYSEMVSSVLDSRVTMMRRRLESAVANESFVSVDPYLFTELVSAPVQMYASRGYRAFTREVAEDIVSIVLAGVRSTADDHSVC